MFCNSGLPDAAGVWPTDAGGTVDQTRPETAQRRAALRR